jgi:hypothetical protein
MGEIGRPTVMIPKVIETIEEELKNGATLAQASFLAGISLRTIYNYFEGNQDFKDRCDLLQGMVAYRARVNIKTKIESGDIDTSKYWLDRKDKDFKPKNDLTSNDEVIQPVLVKFLNDSNEEQPDTTEDNRDSE